MTRLADIASLIGGELVGDGEIEIARVAGIEGAGPHDIALLFSEGDSHLLKLSRASCVVVPTGVKRSEGAYISVNDPYAASFEVAELLSPKRALPLGVDERSIVGQGVTFGESVRVAPQVYIGKGAEIGARTVIHPQVYIGDEVRIGPDCEIHPQVTVKEKVKIGSGVTVHSGAVIGSDGFGYLSEEEGHRKIPSLGDVLIGDEVEIGANVTIDRGTFGSTKIGRGTKIDNLVHIGHNVVIGEDCIVVAQVGIGGSTKLGRNVVLAGQAGLTDHIEVKEGAKVAAKAGVIKSVPANAVVSGFPARPHSREMRIRAATQKLPQLFDRVKKLEEKLKNP